MEYRPTEDVYSDMAAGPVITPNKILAWILSEKTKIYFYIHLDW